MMPELTTPEIRRETVLTDAMHTLLVGLPQNLHTKECRDKAAELRWELGQRLDNKRPEAEAKLEPTEGVVSVATRKAKEFLKKPAKKKGKKKAE